MYIPKTDGSRRPLGIPTFEDKVAQRSITMVLESIYEQDFYPCSYGFRPGKSAYQALHALRTGFMTQGLRWVLDVDIHKYFDSIPHRQLREFLDRRVTDGVIRRMIDKWLKAGVMEEGQLRQSTEVSSQRGVISPLLSNVFLHHVLDEWFETEVRPRLKGRCTLVRYADDLLMGFEDFLSSKRALAVLGKRLALYGLTLHPDKTRFIDFRFKRPNGVRHPATSGTTFDFLGFTHVWVRSRQGKNVVRQSTAKNRFARALSSVSEWCRRNLRRPITEQHVHLGRMMRGHHGYYGTTGNSRRLRWYAHQVERIWQKVALQTWPTGFVPVDSNARAVETPTSSFSKDRPSLHRWERSFSVRNRMLEIRTSGSVRGEGGDVLTHSARGFEYPCAFVEWMKSRIGIGLKGSTEVFEMALRMFSA